LEKGILPQGASTKNAGFACFGSLSELIDDLKTHSEEEVIQLVQKRWHGLQLLRKRLGDATLDFKPYGGYELFLQDDEATYNECLQKMPFLNEILKPLFKADVFSKEVDRFAFANIKEYSIFNPFEGQIDTGNMMQALLKEAVSNDILKEPSIWIKDIIILEILKTAFFLAAAETWILKEKPPPIYRKQKKFRINWRTY